MAARLRALRDRRAPDVLLATGIGLVSVLGAVAAFRASIADQEGGRLLRLSVLQTAQQEQITSILTARVDHDLRTLPLYAEHLNVAASLDAQATAPSDTSVRQTLQHQPARDPPLPPTLHPFFP